VAGAIFSAPSPLSIPPSLPLRARVLSDLCGGGLFPCGLFAAAIAASPAACYWPCSRVGPKLGLKAKMGFFLSHWPPANPVPCVPPPPARPFFVCGWPKVDPGPAGPECWFPPPELGFFCFSGPWEGRSRSVQGPPAARPPPANAVKFEPPRPAGPFPGLFFLPLCPLLSPPAPSRAAAVRSPVFAAPNLRGALTPLVASVFQISDRPLSFVGIFFPLGYFLPVPRPPRLRRSPIALVELEPNAKMLVSPPRCAWQRPPPPPFRPPPPPFAGVA